MAFRLTLKSVALAVIGSLFLIQVLSVFVSSIFENVPVIQGGKAILLMVLGIGIMTVYIIGTNVESLRQKESLIFILIVFASIGLLYWKLEDVFPQIFSVSPEISEAIKSSVGSILGGFG